MTRPDFVTIKENFVNHFFRLFGRSFESCKREIVDIKHGLNSLSNTEVGQEITHVFKGIDLALKTQTRLYLLFDNGYRGFVLLGGHFAVYDGSCWVTPVTPEEVKAELSKLDTHNAAVAKIAELLSDIALAGSKKTVKVSVEDISSATKLMKEMEVREFEAYEHSETFDAELSSLIWQKPYTQLSPDTFLSFLKSYYIDKVLPSDESAMYIPTCRAPVGRPLFKHLATFGPDAPSLWNTRGDAISVLPSEGHKGKEKRGEKPTVPKEIIILPKPVLTAYKDWLEIEKTGTVRFNFKERAKNYRGHVVSQDTMRLLIWETLQEGLEIVESMAEEKAKKKQKLSNVPVASGSQILDLW